MGFYRALSHNLCLDRARPISGSFGSASCIDPLGWGNQSSGEEPRLFVNVPGWTVCLGYNPPIQRSDEGHCPTMTWVKVCGLRREGDVAAAVEAGADAVGFVLAPGSPRWVAPSAARALAVDVPILTVIVTVDLTPDELMAAVAATGVGGVQPHGDHRQEAAAKAQQQGLFVLHPLAVRGPGRSERTCPRVKPPSSIRFGRACTEGPVSRSTGMSCGASNGITCWPEVWARTTSLRRCRAQLRGELTLHRA